MLSLRAMEELFGLPSAAAPPPQRDELRLLAERGVLMEPGDRAPFPGRLWPRFAARALK